MAPFIGTAGEHSGRPPPDLPNVPPGAEILGSHPTALCPAAAGPANGGMAAPAHGGIELRRAQWGAAALAALSALVTYFLWASANHEENPGGVAVSPEPVAYTVVVSPALDESELPEIDPGEVATQPPDSSSRAREVLARQLADEMSAAATRQALLARNRLAISRPRPSDSHGPWPTPELEEELERLGSRATRDLPTIVDPVTTP